MKKFKILFFILIIVSFLNIDYSNLMDLGINGFWFFSIALFSASIYIFKKKWIIKSFVFLYAIFAFLQSIHVNPIKCFDVIFHYFFPFDFRKSIVLLTKNIEKSKKIIKATSMEIIRQLSLFPISPSAIFNDKAPVTIVKIKMGIVVSINFFMIID